MAPWTNLQYVDCFCYVANMSQTVSGVHIKESLIAFANAMIGVLQIVKVAVLMANYEAMWDRIQISVLELTLSCSKQVMDPIRAYMMGLTRSLSANSDCPPIATLATLVKKADGYVFPEFDQIEEEINKALRAIDRVTAKSDELDRWIAVLTEMRDTLQNFCGSV